MNKFESDLFSISETYDYDNLVQIENITRTWFQLMVNLNESPKLRSFFAEEKYIGDSKSNTLNIKLLDNGEDLYNGWEIKATEYTRHFLTSGVVIYEIYRKKFDSADNKLLESANLNADLEVQTLVVTADSKPNETELLRELSTHDNFEVVNLHRWVGCGMKIPKTANIHLDPNIVWPILEFYSDVDGKRYSYRIENSSNIIRWNVSSDDEQADIEGRKGAVAVQDKIVQGQAKGEFEIKGKVVEGSVKLTLPYTCASFDILTKINLGQDDDEQLVIFTS
ncbi:hypothetical protein [Pseudoalteromonas rubra]|uniref:hypothetical protein n=1 Tax=Pseudoalteromonas rubra TaxID=43658 RepID=UPI000F76C26F|nr:hypothetical protein [Pseudoalteromonas rubra]